MGALRKVCKPSEDTATVEAASRIAVGVIEREVPQLHLSFRVPTVDSIAVFWPGAAGTTTPGSVETDQESVDLD